MNEILKKSKKNKTINISLSIEMIEFIEKEIKTKCFRSYAEYIRELIREKMN